MMPCSGPLPMQIEHANAMGTSEFALSQHHAGSPVLTSDRSTYPRWPQAKAAMTARQLSVQN